MSKQKNIFSEKKVRYKMYKAGKSWVIAGMASASFLTINLLQSHDELVARADVTSESSSSKYNFNDKTIVLHNQNSVDVNSESKATNSGNDVNSESKATSSGNDVNSESKATSSGNDVNPESKATSSGNDVNSESKATSSGNDINSEPKATNDSENNKVAEKAEYNGKANTSSATNGDKKKVSKVQLSKKELYSSGNALLRNETGLKNDNEKSPVTTMSGEKIAKQIVARIYADTKKKVASSLVNSTLLAVSSDPDIERESFNDVVNNGKDESPTSVHVALADQVANKDKYYAEAKTNGTLAEVGTWEKFVEAYNNQNITYIKLTQDMSSGISSRNSNNSGSGNPLSPRTNGIIVDGDNHTLDLGLDVSMFVGTAPTGTQFTLTDVKLMQEHSQGSASSGSTRSVIQTPYSNRRENDGLWTFNINNVEYVGAASLTENKGGKYGYPPARLVDMEDSLVNYSGNIKWYSDQELSTNGSVHIADGAKIEYAQTYQNSDMDSVFYFMSWDHVNTVNDTGAAHDIQIGDGAFLDVKATQRNTSADRTVFYNSWTDMNVGNKVTWKQDGFTQLFNSDSDSSIYGGNGDSYSASNRFFTTLIGHDLNHRSIKFGQELDMEVPLVRDRAFYLDRNWSVYFAAATTLKVNLDRSNAAIYLRNGAQLTFISPRKLTIQNNNGKATNTDLFDISGNENGVYSTFSLNNSTINYWNRSAVTSTPTGSLTFQTLQANSRGFQAKDYAGNSLDVGTNSTLGSQTNAFTTLANEPGKIKIRYVNQDNVEVGTTEVPIDNNDYIGKIISLRKPLYVTTNMPNNYMWAIGNQVYSGAVDDKQSGGDITSTTDDGDSYGQATYAIVPAEEAKRDNTYTVYVYGVPETVNYQYVDARTGKVLSSDGLNAGQEHVGNLSPANFGNVIEWKNSYYTQKNVPLGYHYATTTDELNGQVQPDKLTVGSENPVTTIYVAGDDASAKITFVDTQSGASLPDSSITLTGYVGQAPTSGNEFLLPKNYKLDPTTQPNQAAFTSKVNNDGSTTITYTQELTLSNNDIQINLVHDTTEATETKSIKRTIKFVDINNQSVSPNVVQTVNFVRTVTTDKVNGAVQYGEWLAEAGTSFPSFSSPDVTGMFPDVQTVSEQAGITPESNDSEIVVHYYSKVQTVEPTDPKDPGTPVDPNNPDGPKWP
ncbi:KxYKxGKxW signal peptide domain-containing protein, partial [Levilactobacillus brevis]|uniref:mucin-binding protein n=1 Tax=Levilactobacillus brevis TaxID=1580 RepID=UPI001BA89F17